MVLRKSNCYAIALRMLWDATDVCVGAAVMLAECRSVEHMVLGRLLFEQYSLYVTLRPHE